MALADGLFLLIVFCIVIRFLVFFVIVKLLEVKLNENDKNRKLEVVIATVVLKLTLIVISSKSFMSFLTCTS